MPDRREFLGAVAGAVAGAPVIKPSQPRKILAAAGGHTYCPYCDFSLLQCIVSNENIGGINDPALTMDCGECGRKFKFPRVELEEVRNA
jgi:hypothetical protein